LRKKAGRPTSWKFQKKNLEAKSSRRNAPVKLKKLGNAVGREDGVQIFPLLRKQDRTSGADNVRGGLGNTLRGKKREKSVRMARAYFELPRSERNEGAGRAP